MKTATKQTALTNFSSSTLGLGILLLGPVVMVILVGVSGWDPAMISTARVVFLVSWLPIIPISFPALLLQDFRDAARAKYISNGGAGFSWVYTVHKLYVTGPTRVVKASWINLLGVALAVGTILFYF